MPVIPLHHAEQVVRGFLLMRQDEGLKAPVHRGFVIKPPGYVGAEALLAAFEQQRPDLPGSLALALKPGMKKLLGPVEVQRDNLPALGFDLEALVRVKRKAIPQAPQRLKPVCRRAGQADPLGKDQCE